MQFRPRGQVPAGPGLRVPPRPGGRSQGRWGGHTDAPCGLCSSALPQARRLPAAGGGNIGAATVASGLVVVLVAFVLVVVFVLVSVLGGPGDAKRALAAGTCQLPAHAIAAVDGEAVSALVAIPGHSWAAAR